MSNNMTKVLGYFNGARWNIQLDISRFNITLTLKPGEFLLDRQGRKINDPYFELYAVDKRLSRELSDKEVPILYVPPVTSASINQRPSNPVSAVTEWKRDSRGVRQPVMPGSQPAKAALPATTSAVPAASAPMVESNSSSVKPMTMDEARRAGLVRKVREVPEDYGVSDTTGRPPSGIPKMRYAIDPSMNHAAPPLPKEMLNLPKDDPSNAARSTIISTLAAGSKVPNPEDGSTNPFANTGVPNGPADSPLRAGPGVPGPIVESAPAPAGSPSPEMEALPEPDLGELDDASPLRAGQPAQIVAEDAEGPAAEPAEPVAAVPVEAGPPVTPLSGFFCLGCGARQKSRFNLMQHAKARHASQYNQIMAPYPEK